MVANSKCGLGGILSDVEVESTKLIVAIETLVLWELVDDCVN